MQVKVSFIAILFLAVSLVYSADGDYVVNENTVCDNILAHPTFDNWEKYESELLFLCGKGSRKATKAALKVIPAILRTDVVTNVDWLAMAAYNNIDFDEDFTDMSESDVKLILRLYERLLPVDWTDNKKKITGRKIKKSSSN